MSICLWLPFKTWSFPPVRAVSFDGGNWWELDWRDKQFWRRFPLMTSAVKKDLVSGCLIRRSLRFQVGRTTVSNICLATWAPQNIANTSHYNVKCANRSNVTFLFCFQQVNVPILSLYFWGVEIKSHLSHFTFIFRIHIFGISNFHLTVWFKLILFFILFTLSSFTI